MMARKMATRRPRGLGNIEVRGNKYRLRISVDGRREYTEWIEAEDKADAEERLARERKKIQERAKRRRRGRPEVGRFSGLLKEYEKDELPELAPSTQVSYAGTFALAREYFVDRDGDPRLDEITRADVKRFLRWRRRQKAEAWTRRNGGKISLGTLAKEFRNIRRLFGWAVDEEYLDVSPMAGMKGPRGNPPPIVILDADHYEKLLEKAMARDPMFHAYVLLLGESGLRCDSEALWLKWEDVDLAGGFVHVVSGRDGHVTKGKKSRFVPMTPRLAEALREHFARYRLKPYDGKRSQYVFHHTRSRKLTAKRKAYKAGERVKSFKGAFKAAREDAKLSLRVHDLRHRRVTTWLADGKPLALVQAAMGHASITTTEKYLQLVPEHLRALVEEGPSREELKALAR